MKNKTKAILFILAVWITPASLFAQAADIAAIKELIGRETEYFFSVNKQAWSDCWLKTAYTYWSYSDSTSASYIEGWDGLDKSFEPYFKTAKPSKAQITNDWIEIKVYGNGAYVRFIQKVKDEIEHDETNQVRVLEKKDGKWKIICVVAIARYAKTTPESRVRQ